jgi:hypothetical protein
MNVSTTGTPIVLEPGAASTDAPGLSAAEALKRGPIGALTLSIIAISLLLLGWILFYFLLFLGRGPIG